MNCPRFPASFRLLGLFACLMMGACSAAPPEARSLLGSRLERPLQDAQTKKAHLQALKAARRTYKGEPSEENGIQVGLALCSLGRVREAVFHYTGLLRRYPDSYRVRRHRGHRYITLRAFDKAEQDLSIAWGLCERYPDEAEHTAVPGATSSKPTGTDRTNILYHLGLAQYFQGDFKSSLATWELGLKVLGPEPLVASDDHRIAVSFWHRITSARTESKSGFPASLVREDDNVTYNRAYHQLCLLLSGRAEREGFPTNAQDPAEHSILLYGLARWHAEHDHALESRLL